MESVAWFLPADMRCIGRKSPLSIMMDVAVILPLSAEPAVGTHFHPF